MKKYTAISLILLLNCPLAFTQNEGICKSFSNSYKKMYEKQLKSNSTHRAFEVSYYRLELQVNPEVKYINGVVTAYFNTTDTLDTLTFDLSDQLQVDSALYQNQKLSNYQHQNNKLSIVLPATLPAKATDSISIFYQGQPNSNGFGSFVQDSYNEQDSMIWTLSQPYGAAEWWPCQNNLYDKADSISLKITTPLYYKVAANGLLTKIDTIGNQHRFHWESHYPIATYLIGFSITNYEILEEKIALNGDSLLLQHFLYPNDSLGRVNSINQLATFMRYFDSLLGPYPFIKEKYGHASFARGGGMEHQTMSFMGGYGGELMAHELAHQWFGDKITCGSWQDIWLNEGFATYMVLLTYEDNIVHSDYYYSKYLHNLREASFLHPHQSVFRRDTSSVDSIFNKLSYDKGAAVLHTLRWNIGDSAFFSGVRNYLEDSSLVYGFARTKDLQRHFEASSQQNLDEFFKDWVYGNGYPIYTINWIQNEGELKIKIEQQSSDPAVYFFNTIVPLKLKGSNIDTIISIQPRFSGEEYNFAIASKIDSVLFDPQKNVLAKASVKTSLKEFLPSKNRLMIFPNPTKGELQIKTKNLTFSAIELYDISGRLVLEMPFQNVIQLAGLKTGNYIIVLSGDSGIAKQMIHLSH